MSPQPSNLVFRCGPNKPILSISPSWLASTSYLGYLLLDAQACGSCLQYLLSHLCQSPSCGHYVAMVTQSNSYSSSSYILPQTSLCWIRFCQSQATPTPTLRLELKHIPSMGGYFVEFMGWGGGSSLCEGSWSQASIQWLFPQPASLEPAFQ